LVATAEAKPLLNAVNSSAKESSGLLIVGPEGGKKSSLQYISDVVLF
jgi:ABC-type Mn2+/Zn2+ transport system ATPase subunit